LALIRTNELRIKDLEQYLSRSGFKESTMFKSWMLEVQVEPNGPWNSTQPRFSTREQVEQYGAYLALRSDLMTDYRAVETTDETTSYWDQNLNSPVPIEMYGEPIALQDANPIVMGETWPGDTPDMGDILAAEQEEEDEDEDLAVAEMAVEADRDALEEEDLEANLVAEAAVAEEQADIADAAVLQAEADAEAADDAAEAAEEALDIFEVSGAAADVPEISEPVNPYLMSVPEFLEEYEYADATEYLSECLDHDDPGQTLALCRQTCLIDPGSYCEHGCPAAVTVILSVQTGRPYAEAADLVRVAEETPVVETVVEVV
jgi:hypothetical protein